MLSVLKIKNLALVDDLVWDLGNGLVAVTGQTGAGKSMIVGALKLILGERANHDLIRTGESACSVEAIFELSTNLPRVNALLEEAGIDPCEGNTLVVKRVFGSGGGNKQFINCSPATLAVLKNLGDHLVDLHGPHEHQSLLSQERQLAMLDAYAGAARERAAYDQAYRAWQAAERELGDFQGMRQATGQEIELLRHQVTEISRAGLDPVAVEEMEARYELARHSGKLVDQARHAMDELADRVLPAAVEISRALRELERFDPGASGFRNSFEDSHASLEELGRQLAKYLDRVEIDPKEWSELEHRIDELEGLKRKYGQTVGEILQYGEQATRRLGKIDSRDDELARLEKAVATTRAKVEQTARGLSQKRAPTAPRLAREIAGHLEDLGFKQSAFSLRLESLPAPGPQGKEVADFLFAPNPGEPPKPLRIIASSGEMSRVMLAVKSALASEDQIPLMVFDEIDANVGGEIAHAVGAKMASLGEKHQVLAITHMPQVAARAHFHYVVTKEFGDAKTRSLLRRVEDGERIDELARMLGGGGKKARALAETMLSGREGQE